MGMNLSLGEARLPVRLRFESPMTDDQLLHFCAVNDVWQIEREENGEIVVMTPAGLAAATGISGYPAWSTSGPMGRGSYRAGRRIRAAGWFHAVA